MIHAEALYKFIRAPKPDWCSGLDIAMVAHLITLADEEGHSSPLQSDLALGAGASTINFKGLRKSLDRLHEHSWITWRKGIKGVPGERHHYQVHFENLPGKEEHEQSPTITRPNQGEDV
jgi:hypothetical protein